MKTNAQEIHEGLGIILDYNISSEIYTKTDVNEIVVDGIVKSAMMENDYKRMIELNWYMGADTESMWLHIV